MLFYKRKKAKNIFYKMKNFGINKNLFPILLNTGLNTRIIPKIAKKQTLFQIYKKSHRKNKTGNHLKIFLKKRIDHFIDIKCYKGYRFRNHYPVRGQRTHTNAKTIKRTFW